ncbi:hypothetical protein [Klebsiella quasivariicola]|uniref:hypothetical protein n=1 Tax=Klebsiella quasivariicola TaxID=2026240 RepID=UPI001CCF2432|nr:hypothetical protein [Klebsiella quasivariicola]MBZ9583446.1 hypothetical protein [Klebsiella quasivariicola]
MAIQEVTFDCSEVRIEGVRYDLIRVVADHVDIDDVMKAIKLHDDTSEALDCIGEDDVVEWLQNKGYEITKDSEAA